MFDLNSITSASEVWKPQKIVVYGVQGLGKSLFGSTFNAPIFIRTEDGIGAIDVPTFPKVVSDFYELAEAVKALHGEHKFKTVVIDSLDWVEPIIWKKTCEDHGKESIEEFGYGKGYVEADADWRYIMGGLDSLRLNKGMDIVLIAHAEIKTFNSPETEPYDRYQIKLHKRAFALWQEWADMVLFCNYKVDIAKSKEGFNKEVKRGKGSGERIIYTEERPAFLAKNRWGLPPEIYIGQDKTWSGFHQAMSEATGGKYKINTKKEEVKK